VIFHELKGLALDEVGINNRQRLWFRGGFPRAYLARTVAVAGSELDLLIVSGGRRLGFEIKRTSSPRLTPSIRNAMKDLKLRSLDVVHSGDKTYPLGQGVRAVAISRMFKDVKPIRQ
jgi:hypothetical protein